MLKCIYAAKNKVEIWQERFELITKHLIFVTCLWMLLISKMADVSITVLMMITASISRMCQTLITDVI